MSLESYISSPIPILANPPTARDYGSVPVVPRKNRSEEPLVKVSDYAIPQQSYYAMQTGNPPYNRAFDAAYPNVWVRKTLARHLAEINEDLQHHDIALLCVDGYRSPRDPKTGKGLQVDLWNFFYDLMKKDHPGASEDELVKLNCQFVSDPRRFNPDDSTTWPTHSTGGAIDLTLIDRKTGVQKNMGGPFDSIEAFTITFYYEQHPSKDQEALKNRRILFWKLKELGLVNYGYEWWHYDVRGTQMYTANRRAYFPNEGGMSEAYYGPSNPPPELTVGEEKLRRVG